MSDPKRRQGETDEEHAVRVELYREQQRDRERERYQTDPAFRARNIQRALESEARIKADPVRHAARAARRRERARERYQNDPQYREKMKEYARKRAKTPAEKERERKRGMRKRFGRDDVQPMGPGVCESCGEMCDGSRGPTDLLVTDHDHGTGQLRGRICYKCNCGIGFLGDNADGVRAALRYLERAERRRKRERERVEHPSLWEKP